MALYHQGVTFDRPVIFLLTNKAYYLRQKKFAIQTLTAA